MLKLNKKDKRTNLEKEIDRVLDQMADLRGLENKLGFDEADDKDGSKRHFLDERYVQLNSQLEKLYKMRDIEKKNELNPNSVITVGGSVLTVVGILLFEKTDILRTKALQFVIRGRV